MNNIKKNKTNTYNLSYIARFCGIAAISDYISRNLLKEF